MPTRETTPLHVVARREQRAAALATLGYASYGDYLNSPAWDGLRRRYYEQRPRICHTCGAGDGVQLHHRTYERVGREELDDLMPLCNPCHGMVHALERRGDASLDFEGVIDAERAREGRRILAAAADRRTQERRDRVAARREAIKAQPLAQRILLAQRAWLVRGKHPNDIRDQVRRAERCIRLEQPAAEKAVQALERLAYGQAL